MQIQKQQPNSAVVGLASEITGAGLCDIGTWAASKVSAGMVMRAAATKALILLIRFSPVSWFVVLSFWLRDSSCGEQDRSATPPLSVINRTLGANSRVVSGA